MKQLLSGLSALALITSLPACTAEEPTKNVSTNDMNAMMADPNNPFAQSEMAMDEAINAAVGVNAADSWVRKMIEHHKGAVDMSRILLTQNPAADVAKMAQQTIDKQGKEIEELQKLISSGNADPASAELYRAATTEMHNEMMSAKGANVSETYLRKMLAHHQGAVAMSDVALANGATGAIRDQIEKTKAEQQKEIAVVEAMLRGEPMNAGATPTAEPAPKKPSPSKEVKPVSQRPGTAKSTPAKSEPAEAPVPAADCTPEHRAAGHC